VFGVRQCRRSRLLCSDSRSRGRGRSRSSFFEEGDDLEEVEAQMRVQTQRPTQQQTPFHSVQQAPHVSVMPEAYAHLTPELLALEQQEQLPPLGGLNPQLYSAYNKYLRSCYMVILELLCLLGCPQATAFD